MKTQTNQSAFWQLLFRSDEWVNVCYSRVQETKSYPVEIFDFENLDSKYACINPLKPNTTRRTPNIAEFRNFLVEFDDGSSIEEQLKRVADLHLPFTTAVFSGNKSVHFVIAFQQGVPEAKYRELARRMAAVIPGVDKACLEPCRLTRVPNKFLGQRLLETRPPITCEHLEIWLTMQGLPKPDSADSLKATLSKGGPTTMTQLTRDYLDGKIPSEEAHRAMLATIRNLLELGFEPEEVYDAIAEARGVEDRKTRHSIWRAIKWVLRNWK